MDVSIKADLAGNAVERDAKIRLKREHDKLVARLGVGGGLAVIFLTILVLVVADKMGRLPGGLFVGGVALVSMALFLASFVSVDFAESVNRALSGKTEDPLTGKPLRMLWWFRWFAAMLGLFLFVGLSDYASPPAQSPESSAETEADSAPIAQPTQQQILDARLALCLAVADELETVRLGKPHKDAIVLASQFSVGEKAGGRAIGHEWFAYQRRRMARFGVPRFIDRIMGAWRGLRWRSG